MPAACESIVIKNDRPRIVGPGRFVEAREAIANRSIASENPGSRRRVRRSSHTLKKKLQAVLNHTSWKR